MALKAWMQALQRAEMHVGTISTGKQGKWVSKHYLTHQLDKKAVDAHS